MLDFPKNPAEKAVGIEANVAGTMLGVLAEGGPIMGSMGKRNHALRGDRIPGEFLISRRGASTIPKSSAPTDAASFR